MCACGVDGRIGEPPESLSSDTSPPAFTSIGVNYLARGPCRCADCGILFEELK
jgi:hypothetical protein